MMMKNIQLILIIIFILIKLGHFYKLLINKCPNQKNCKCDYESKILKCHCNVKKCVNNFQNLTLYSFNEIQIKNFDTIQSNYFGSQLTKEIRVKFHRPTQIESYAFNSTELKHLEIVYNDIKQIEPNAFKNMKCDFVSLISFGKNIDLSLDYFDSDTFIKALSIDYNFNSNQFKKIFFITNHTSSNLTSDELEEVWSSRAIVRNLFIRDVRGIETLDSSWAPKFESLDRIEIIRTDIRLISRFFSQLHSKNLKYLTISKSKLETLESNVFEDLKNLRTLDLSFNSIKFIELEAFHGLNALKVLKLKSISTNNFIDDLDMCMLSYLPCNINVHLDDYDGSMFSCALIYLNEIRYEKSYDYIDLLKSLTLEELNYKRDNECKLKETLNYCFNLTNNRNNKCVYKSFKFENSTNENHINDDQDELFALVDITLNNKTTTTSTAISSTSSYNTTESNDEIFALLEIRLVNKTTQQNILNQSETTIIASYNGISTTTTSSTWITSSITSNSTITSTVTPISSTKTTPLNTVILNKINLVDLINTTDYNINKTEIAIQINISNLTLYNLTTKMLEINRTNYKMKFINETNTTLLSFNLYENKSIETTDSTNQAQNQTDQNVFVFSQNSTQNKSYNSLLILFKISISLLIFLLFLMSIANLYLLYSNRLSKGYSSNQVNIVNNSNEDKSISLKSFGFRKSSIFFMRENSVGDAAN